MNSRLGFALPLLTLAGAFAAGCASPAPEAGETQAAVSRADAPSLTCLIPQDAPTIGDADVWTFDEAAGTLARATAFYDWSDVIFVNPPSATWSVTFHKPWGDWDLYLGGTASGGDHAGGEGDATTFQLILMRGPDSGNSSVALSGADGSQATETTVQFRRRVPCPR